jgi:uncharacterized protein YeeX (DUF496 family)
MPEEYNPVTSNLIKFTTICHNELKKFIPQQTILAQPVNMENFFNRTSTQTLSDTIKINLQELSYNINDKHRIIKHVIKNLKDTLDYFKVLKSEGIVYKLRIQYQDKKDDYYFTNAKLELWYHEIYYTITSLVKCSFDIQVEMKIKQNNDSYVTHFMTFTPILFIENDYSLSSTTLKFMYRNGGISPTIDIEIILPNTHLNTTAVLMTEYTDCLMYALAYNKFDIENDPIFKKLRKTIQDEIDRRQLISI